MTDPACSFERCAPYFPVSNIEEMVRHYVDVLGFVVEYRGGDPVEFAIVSRDGFPLMLRRVDEADIRPNEARGGTWDAFFWVRGLPALVDELVDSGAEVAYGPVVQEAYGMNEFAVRDPEGYVLGFGETI